MDPLDGSPSDKVSFTWVTELKSTDNATAPAPTSGGEVTQRHTDPTAARHTG